MMINEIELNRIRENLWEIPSIGNMRVPGRIYISENMINKNLKTDDALKQVMNVAHLPGIEKYSLAMPDIHWGYGFPIGGVAATDLEEGVISPGGVGYDINCGVRLAVTNLQVNAVKKRIEHLVSKLFEKVPTGVGSQGAIKKLSKEDLKKVLESGSVWAAEHDMATQGDIEFTEESGTLKNSNPDIVSKRALERGANQAGTLGSGNHFLEVDVVDEIYNNKAAEVFGLFKDQVVVLIHTGSRGLGYQVCDDYLRQMGKAVQKYGISLPDRQLASAPVASPEGETYFAAMACAANYAWANRQCLMHWTRETLEKTLGASPASLNLQLVYDVCHNIAKKETHIVDGEKKKVCVHRKGATRAFPADHPEVPECYRSVGQPVLIPGDMGTNSYVLVGTELAMQETFGSTCHGAGRVRSRSQSKRVTDTAKLLKDLEKKGIVVMARGRSTIAEEAPEAYKDVDLVVEAVCQAGIANKVARLNPMAVIKG